MAAVHSSSSAKKYLQWLMMFGVTVTALLVFTASGVWALPLVGPSSPETEVVEGRLEWPLALGGVPNMHFAMGSPGKVGPTGEPVPYTSDDLSALPTLRVIAADWPPLHRQGRSGPGARMSLAEAPSLPIQWPAPTLLPSGDQQAFLYFDSPVAPSILHVQLFDSVDVVTGEPSSEPVHETLCEMGGFGTPPSCLFSEYQNGTSSVRIFMPALDGNLYAVAFAIWTADPTAMEEDATASYLMQFEYE